MTDPIYPSGTLVVISEPLLRVYHPSGTLGCATVRPVRPTLLARTSGGREKQIAAPPRYTVVLVDGPYAGWWGWAQAPYVRKVHPLVLLAEVAE